MFEAGMVKCPLEVLFSRCAKKAQSIPEDKLAFRHPLLLGRGHSILVKSVLSNAFKTISRTPINYWSFYWQLFDVKSNKVIES